MNRPYHPDESVDAREAGSAYAESANSPARLAASMRNVASAAERFPSEGETSLADLNLQLSNLREEANELLTRLDPVLQPPGPPVPMNAAGGTAGGAVSDVVAAIREATSKVAIVRGTLSQIRERFQF